MGIDEFRHQTNFNISGIVRFCGIVKMHAAWWGLCNNMKRNGDAMKMFISVKTLVSVKTFVVVVTSVFGLVGAAVAADIPTRQPPPPTPIVGKAPIGKAPIGKYPVGKGPIFSK